MFTELTDATAQDLSAGGQLSRESVAGKGGTEYITTSLYFDVSGNQLPGDPRI